VILQQKEDIRRMKDISPGIHGNPQALIMLCVDRKKAFDKAGEDGRDVLTIMDAAIAAQNICLVGTEMGVGSCMIRNFDRVAARELLDLPENLMPELLVSLGYPKSIPEPPSRRSFEEVVISWKGKGRKNRDLGSPRTK
jgi:nitroreductase